jgi:hypothetical protein
MTKAEGVLLLDVTRMLTWISSMLTWISSMAVTLDA